MSWIAGAQAVGSILGGLGGMFGGSKGPSRKREMDSYRLQAQAQRENLKPMMDAYKDAGIHPIYGLGGSSMSYSPSFSGTGDQSVGEGISRMGQGISRAAEALASERERLQNRAIETQIEGQELENAKKAADLRLKTLPGTAPGLNQHLSEVPGRLGLADGIYPLLRVGVDDKGNPVRIYNEEDLGEGGELLQAVMAARYSIPDLWHGNVTQPAARAIKNMRSRWKKRWKNN